MNKSKLAVVILPLVMMSLASCGGGNGGTSTTQATTQASQTTQESKIFTPDFAFGVNKAILKLRVVDDQGTNEFIFYKLKDQYGSLEFDPAHNARSYSYFLKKPGSDKYTSFTASETGPQSTHVDWAEQGEVGNEKDVIKVGLNYLYNVPTSDYSSVNEEFVNFGIRTSEKNPVTYRFKSNKYDYAGGVSFNYCDLKADSSTPAMTFVQKRTSSSENFSAEVLTVDVYQQLINFPLNIPTVS